MIIKNYFELIIFTKCSIFIYIQDQYAPPKIPVDLPNFDLYKPGKFEFGKKAREKHFYLEVRSIKKLRHSCMLIKLIRDI